MKLLNSLCSWLCFHLFYMKLLKPPFCVLDFNYLHLFLLADVSLSLVKLSRVSPEELEGAWGLCVFCCGNSGTVIKGMQS